MTEPIESPTSSAGPGRFLILCAAFVIVAAGMKVASSVAVPFLLAIFITILVAPWFVGLRRWGVPAWLALLLMILILVIVAFLGIGLISRALASLSSSMPQYQARLQAQIDQFLAWLDGHGVEILGPVIGDAFNPQSAMSMATATISTVSDVLGQSSLVLIIAIFMLLEGAIMPEKIKAMTCVSDDWWSRLQRIVEDVRHYMAMKTLMSLLTGALVAAWLASLGVNHPLLFGFLAFVLNYIPTIGSIIAAIPGVLLCLLEFGIARTLVCGLGYTAINVLVSNGIEPRFLAQRLGLSPLVILLSMIFWGWLLGPMGMLLSVPLTMTVRIALESGEHTRDFAMLLGTGTRARDRTAAAREAPPRAGQGADDDREPAD